MVLFQLNEGIGWMDLLRYGYDFVLVLYFAWGCFPFWTFVRSNKPRVDVMDTRMPQTSCLFSFTATLVLFLALHIRYNLVVPWHFFKNMKI